MINYSLFNYLLNLMETISTNIDNEKNVDKIEFSENKDMNIIKNEKQKQNTKIVFKNKTDRPDVNPFTNLCDFFLKNKTRFCKFEKMEGFDFCKYHNEGVLVMCNLCEHKILERKLDMHKKVCKAIKLEKKLNNSYFILLVQKEYQFIKTN